MKAGRLAALAVLYAALIAGGAAAGGWLVTLVDFDIRPSTEPQIHTMIMTIAALYFVASALPFVPGAEVGLALILLLGGPIVPLVYLSMVGALSLAYAAGRLVPPGALAAAFGFFGAARARDMVLRLAPLTAAQRVALLTARAPRRMVPFLLRHRYLALAAALNMPGNSLLGGGGGIALAVGMSGLFPPAPYLLTIALAVAPVPLFFLLAE